MEKEKLEKVRNYLLSKRNLKAATLLLVSSLMLTSCGKSYDAKEAEKEEQEETVEETVSYLEIKIQSGDKLANIAKRYNTTVDELVSINNIENPDKIKIGDVIKVPVIITNYDTVDYKVKVGENLTVIANHYGITLNELLSMNPNITNPNKIKSGDIIKVPSSYDNQENVDINLQCYIVERGDNLTTIAKKFNITIEEILKYNTDIVNQDRINPGDILYINTDIKLYDEYILGENEDLYDVADKLGIDPYVLFTINNNDELQAGDTVYIPKNIKVKEEVSEETEEDELIDSSYEKQDIEERTGVINDWDEALEKNGYVKGIDVSIYQNSLSIGKLFDNYPNLKFCMVRSHYFFDRKEPDKRFKEICRIANEHNVAVAPYFWPTLTSVESSKEECDIIIKELDELRSEGIYMQMPIAIDIERKSDGGGGVFERIMDHDTETLEALKYMVKRLQDEGYYVIFYSSDKNVCDIKTKYLNDKDPELNSKKGIFSLDTWVSRYKSSKSISFDSTPSVNALDYKSSVGIRQYSDHGKVKDYDGDVDFNMSYINYPQLFYKNGLNKLYEIELDNEKSKSKN